MTFHDTRATPSPSYRPEPSEEPALSEAEGTAQWSYLSHAGAKPETRCVKDFSAPPRIKSGAPVEMTGEEAAGAAPVGMTGEGEERSAKTDHDIS